MAELNLNIHQNINKKAMSVRNYALERYHEPTSQAIRPYRDDQSSVSGSASRSQYSRGGNSGASRSYDSRSRYSQDSRSYRTGDSYDSRSYRSGDSRGSRSYYSRDDQSYDSRSIGSRSSYTSYSRVHPNKGREERVTELRNNIQNELNMTMMNGSNTNGKGKSNEFDHLSESEKLSSILQRSDVERHKHNLSAEYYRFRKYALFIPTLLILLFITVVGFVVDTDVIMDHMKVGDSSTREFLVLLLASMGFLCLIFVLLQNALDYNSKINMHRGAAVDLECLSDKIKMYRVERTMDQEAMEEEEERLAEMYGEDDRSVFTDVESQSGSMFPPKLSNALVPVSEGGEVALAAANGGDAALANAIAMQKQIIQKSKLQQRKIDKKNEALTKTLVMQKVAEAKRDRENIKNVVEFYGYSVALQQISVGCKSDVPIRIAKFFDVMETRVELMSLSRTLGVAQDEEENDQDESSGRMRKNQIIRLCANEIYNEVNGFWAWPLFVPSVDGAIERSLKRVGQLLNMNYRARKRCKVFPCCSIPLCCKKKASSNVFAIINEGIDQRELDMMQVERMELMRMEKERKARRMAAKPEEVLEMGGGVATSSRRKTEEKEPKRIKSGSKADDDSRRSRDDASVPSIDPDGQTFAGMITEGTASTYSRRDPGGYQQRSVASRHVGDENSAYQSNAYQSYTSSEPGKRVRLLKVITSL